MRPVKTQISLDIRPVWSESSLCAQWVAKGRSFLHADSEDSDQTGRMPRLIWVFAGRTTTLSVLSWGGSYYFQNTYNVSHVEDIITDIHMLWWMTKLMGLHWGLPEHLARYNGIYFLSWVHSYPDTELKFWGYVTYYFILHTLHQFTRSVRVADRLALPTSVHGAAGSNPAGSDILSEPKRRFIAQSLSCTEPFMFTLPSSRNNWNTVEVTKNPNSSIHPSIYYCFSVR